MVKIKGEEKGIMEEAGETKEITETIPEIQMPKRDQERVAIMQIEEMAGNTDLDKTKGKKRKLILTLTTDFTI